MAGHTFQGAKDMNHKKKEKVPLASKKRIAFLEEQLDIDLEIFRSIRDFCSYPDTQQGLRLILQKLDEKKK